MKKQLDETCSSILEKIETLKILVSNCNSDKNTSVRVTQPNLDQVVEETEAFLQLYSVVSTKVSDESLLVQLITMLSNILSRVLQVLIDCASYSSSVVDSSQPYTSSLLYTSSSVQDNKGRQLCDCNQTSQAVFEDYVFSGTCKGCHSWGYCHLEKFYFWSSCSYQAVFHYNNLSIAYCKDEDILHVVNTIYETYKETFFQPNQVNIQEIQSHLCESVQQSICEWDLIIVLVESVEYVLQGNSVSYLVDSLCSYLLEDECLNSYGWRMIGSFLVMMEVLLSKVTQLDDSNFSNRLTPSYIQFMLLRFFGCTECSTRRCIMSRDMFQGIITSVLQIYKLQHYSEAVLSLYLDLFYLFSSPSFTISYRNEMEGLFQWMREITNGDWIQEMNQNKSFQHNELLSETVVFILRWLPFSFLSKIGYHSSPVPLNIYRSPHRLDWLLLALERQYQQKKLIFSSNQSNLSDWIQLMIGYLLSIYVFETSTKICYEKVICKHIWKWLRQSVDCCTLWQSSLVLLAVVGRTWLIMSYFPKCELDNRQFWILTERLVSLLQIEQLGSSQKTILAWTLVFMWPSFILSKNCQSDSCYLETNAGTVLEKTIISRLFQWYEKSDSRITTPWLQPIASFWIQYYKHLST